MADNDRNDGGDGDDGDYEVGFGRPPRHTRFRKGQSGNPRGPKKGSRALKTDLDQALKARLTITVGGKKRKGTTQELAMFALAIKAATGDLRASRLLADLVLNMFGPGERGGGENKLSKQDAELLDRLLNRLEPDPPSAESVSRCPESTADDSAPKGDDEPNEADSDDA
jgi:hypothetical protein